MTRKGLAFSDMKPVPGGRAPDFCMVGAAKCASTSINAILADHPGLFMNPLKEPHYYSTDAFYGRRRDWYFGLYADAEPTQLLGEASTSYARFPIVGPDVPARMVADNPDMKIILNVREPVARLKSECIQEIKYRTYALGETVTVESLDSFLEQSEASPLHRAGKIEAGYYIEQLDRFLAHFPKEAVKVVFYEDFRDDPHAFIQDLVAFIGAAPAPPFDMAHENLTHGVVEEVMAVNAIRWMDRVWCLRALRQMLPKSLRLIVRNALVNNKVRRYAFSADKIAELRAHYAPHNDKLRAYSSRSLENWS